MLKEIKESKVSEKLVQHILILQKDTNNCIQIFMLSLQRLLLLYSIGSPGSSKGKYTYFGRDLCLRTGGRMARLL
jgi:hypothetical protein